MTLDAGEGIAALRRAILADAEETARSEIDQARGLASQELEAARVEARGEAERILRDAERQAEAMSRRTASVGELEAKKRLLEVRERLLRQLLDRAMAEAGRISDPRERRESLMRLLLEAAHGTGGGTLEVQTSAQDARLLTTEFLAEARRRLSRDGIRAELQPAKQPASVTGGAIVSQEEGRIVVDNSLEARLKRQEAQLRGDAWRFLCGDGCEGANHG